MAFTRTSSEPIEVFQKAGVADYYLKAKCAQFNQSPPFGIESEINLDDYLGIKDGAFSWGGKHFSSHVDAKTIELDKTSQNKVTILKANLKSGGHIQVNLDDQIGNLNGHLAVVEFWPSPEEVVNNSKEWPISIDKPHKRGLDQARAKYMMKNHSLAPVPPQKPDSYDQGSSSSSGATANAAVASGTMDIAIIGAGSAGMYSALLIKYLGIDANVTIYEANRERTGGRIYTHYFDKDGSKQNPDDANKTTFNPAFWDYVDMGAMRFPDLPNQYNLWRLIQFLNLTARGDLKDTKYSSLDGPSRSQIHFDYYFMAAKNVYDRAPANLKSTRGYYNNKYLRENDDGLGDVYNFASTGVPEKFFYEMPRPDTKVSDLNQPFEFICDKASVSYWASQVFATDLKRLWNAYWGDTTVEAVWSEIAEKYDGLSVRDKISRDPLFRRRYYKSDDMDPNEDRPLLNTHEDCKDHKKWFTNLEMTRVVNYIETINKATNMLDSSYLDMLSESFNFSSGSFTTQHSDRRDYSWRLIRGGTSRFTDSLEQWLKSRADIKKGKRVIGIHDLTKVGANPKIKLVIKDSSAFDLLTQQSEDPETQKKVQKELNERKKEEVLYDHVISTVTLTQVRTMDIDWSLLTPSTNMAIRTLTYEHSVKIGFRFTRRWWELEEFEEKVKGVTARIGGLASTDLSIRTLVFPSYGYPEWKPDQQGSPNQRIVPKSDLPGAMLVSYNWALDADNLANMPRYVAVKKAYENLRDLFEIKDIDGEDPLKQYFKKSEYEGVPEFAFINWNQDPNALGAFGVFSPGQFSSLWPEMTVPYPQGEGIGDKRLHWGGEVLSTNHGWIVGALDSAYRCVRQILRKELDDAKKGGDKEKEKYWQDKLTVLKDWGVPEELDDGAPIAKDELVPPPVIKGAQQVKYVRANAQHM